MKRTALIAGCTGFLGEQLIRRLLVNPNYGEVRAVSRREPGDDPRIEWLPTDFSDLSVFGDRLAVDDVFCCLGTTLKKCDNSRQEFERIEIGMVVDLARACHAAGARRFYVVSTLGASRFSPSYHLRVKGRMERAIRRIPFEGIGIIRPSLFIGARDDELRFWENFLQETVADLVTPLLIGPLQPLRPRVVDFVAETIVMIAMLQERGVHVRHIPLRREVAAAARIAAGPSTAPSYDEDPPEPKLTAKERQAKLAQFNTMRQKALAAQRSNATAVPQAWGDASRAGPYAVHEPPGYKAAHPPAAAGAGKDEPVPPV